MYAYIYIYIGEGEEKKLMKETGRKKELDEGRWKVLRKKDRKN